MRSVRARPGIITALTAWILAGAGILGAGLLLGPRPDLLLAVLLAQAAVLLPVALLVLRLPPRELGLGPASGRSLLAGIGWGGVGLLLSLAAGMLVVACAGRPPDGQPVEQAIRAIHERQGWVGLILLTAVLPGIAEEALFRGVILHGLRRRLPAWAAVLLAAAAFACLHVSPWRLLPQLCLGCLLGWLTLRCGSCWPAAIAHAVHNAALVLLSLLAQSAVAGQAPA